MVQTLRSHMVAYTKRTTLQNAFEQFVMVKELEGLKERTIKEHIIHFRYFMEYLERKGTEIKYVDEIDVHICRGYVFFMKKEKHKWDNHQFINDAPDQGLSPVTINIRLRSLKAQFNFYLKEGFISSNPPLH